jgi:alpha-galactosidase
MMDLTNPEVIDYIVNSVNTILQNHHIEYVKWDYNRNVTDSFSSVLKKDEQLGYAHRYALGLYELCERIVAANPDIIFEGCASGGARFDTAILCYFPQIWTSDDTDANERTKIQYGTSIAYPLSAMSAHISVVPNHQTKRVTDITTRASIAHLGATGYELDASSFTSEQREETKAQIAEYKSMETLVLEGDLYRTDDPFESNFFGFMLVSKDKSKGMLTVYRRLGGALYTEPVKRFRVPGLAPDKKYLVEELGLTLGGDTLASVGLAKFFPEGDFTTMKFHFTEVK